MNIFEKARMIVNNPDNYTKELVEDAERLLEYTVVFDATNAVKEALEKHFSEEGETENALPEQFPKPPQPPYPPVLREGIDSKRTPECMFDNLDPNKAYGLVCNCPKHSFR